MVDFSRGWGRAERMPAWLAEQETGRGVSGAELWLSGGCWQSLQSRGPRGVAGDFSRHGQARRQRWLQWSQTAKGGQRKKALLSVEKEEKSVRGLNTHTHTH